MRLFFHELRAGQRLFWRNREAAFFTFMLPVIFFLIFGSIYGNDRIGIYKASSFLEAGMIGYGVAATAFAGLAITMVIRRESGVLKRIRSTPLPPATYIAAVLGSTLIVFALQTAVLVVLGRILFSVPFPARWISLVLTCLLGAAAFAALGLAITAAVHSAEGSSAVVNAIYLPMAIISGTFFSPHSYPPFLRAVADVLPLTYFTQLTRDVLLNGKEIWEEPYAVLVVTGWGLVGLIVAVRRFRWEPRGT